QRVIIERFTDAYRGVGGAGRAGVEAEAESGRHRRGVAERVADRGARGAAEQRIGTDAIRRGEEERDTGRAGVQIAAERAVHLSQLAVEIFHRVAEPVAAIAVADGVAAKCGGDVARYVRVEFVAHRQASAAAA